MKIGSKYKNKAGLVGTIENINGVARLVVKNANGKITQTISPRKLDLEKFEQIS